MGGSGDNLGAILEGRYSRVRRCQGDGVDLQPPRWTPECVDVPSNASMRPHLEIAGPENCPPIVTGIVGGQFSKGVALP
jgi:hypothetical protein